jgi:hypothetical protein
MALFLFGQGDNEDPADARQIDLDQAGNSGNRPFWVSFQYWTEVADLAAGGFSMDINYEDPTGSIRQINGSILNLTDASSAGGSDGVCQVMRLDTSSRFTLDWICPNPGTAKIKWRLFMTGYVDEIIQSISTGP